MAVVSRRGPCPHRVVDDVCPRCSLVGRTFPVSQPSLTDRERMTLLATFDSGQITHGPMVLEFERALAERLGVAHVVATSSGTTALHLALLAAIPGIGPEDEVLVPDITFVATANAVAYTGARPVLVEIDPTRGWSLSLEDAERKLSGRTVGMIPVHLYGEPAPMDDILRFAERHRLTVVEDAAEGLGGTFRGEPLGTLGDVGCFSFFGNKIITTGEGGALATNSLIIADHARHLRGQGQGHRRYFHEVLGYNYRMTSLQAALGVAQLERMGDLLTRRQAVMGAYRDVFARRPHPAIVRYSTPDAAPWLFTVEFSDEVTRTRVQQTLSVYGVDTRPMFVPMHALPMYEHPDVQFPVSSTTAAASLSLPTYPDLDPLDARLIASLIVSSLAESIV